MEEAGIGLSRKFVSIAAGEAHTLAVTGDGKVYSWGRGTFGRLGTGTEADELVPVGVNFQNFELKIVAVAAGAYHSLALAGYLFWSEQLGRLDTPWAMVVAKSVPSAEVDDGSVWGWGYNTYGQLGFNGDNSAVPIMMEQFLELQSPNGSRDDSEVKHKESLKVSAVQAGGMTSLAIDSLGRLWMWGSCPQQNINEEGSPFTSYFTPSPVRDFFGCTVIKVACGSEHIIALVSAGETQNTEDLVCYSWGCNGYGQLGLGDREHRLHPEVVENFGHDSEWVVYQVACGGFHTALLARRNRTDDPDVHMCWTFGLGDNGQLGHGSTQSSSLPEPVKDLPQNVHPISVDCGLFHTSVVSSAGDVWSWGMAKGLGLCPDASFTGTDAGDALSPLLIPCSELQGTDDKFQEPVQVSCGAAHTVLLANNGNRLWSWGRGTNGVLGNGATTDCFSPSIVSWPPKTEEEKKLASAMEEMKLLESRHMVMERYASILHGSVFGKPFKEEDIPVSLQNSDTFDMAREWDGMLDSADRSTLVRLEMFYRSMIQGVKDKLMRRRIKEIVEECVQGAKATESVSSNTNFQ